MDCCVCLDKIEDGEAQSLENCDHKYCKDCFKQLLENAVNGEEKKILCFACENPFTFHDLRKSIELMEKEEKEEKKEKEEEEDEPKPISLTDSLRLFLNECDDIVCCPQCQNIFERVPISKEQMDKEIVKDDRGVKITGEALEHYFNRRFRCRNCKTIFCSECTTIPYHIGFTCKMFQSKGEAIECRYCETPLPENVAPYFSHNQKGVFYICEEEDCIKKAENCCLTVLPCGHACYGVRGEMECMRCIHPDCANGGTNAEEFCTICYCESHSCSPNVELSCSHVFHHSCLQYRLDQGYPTSFISFKFATCSLCDTPISHPNLNTESIRKLEEIVKKKALERAIIEGLDKDPNALAPFGGKLEDYAMAKLAFYECFKCGDAYYGGMRNCDPGANAQQEAGQRNNKEDRLCTGCSGLKAKCELHGTDYYEFKCRFCCGIATFFCGGLCHYCDPCHDIAGELTNFNDWSTNWDCPKIKECPGPESCPLKIKHAKNGEEYALGCVLCKANSEKQPEPENK